MRLPVRCLEIKTIEISHSEMERMGVDPAAIRIMAPKQFHYNLKVEGLTQAQANAIKEDMVSTGVQAAFSKGAPPGAVGYADAIISGTLEELKALAGRLISRSIGLPDVASSIDEALENLARDSFTIKAKGIDRVIGPRTLVMGILNATPDSFSDGGLFFDPERAVERGLEMAEEGADWVDVGGESTRPWAAPVGADEELKRVIPVVEALSSRGVAVSIDTTKAIVARDAIAAGAVVINDVSALSADPGMAALAAESGAPVVLMHMRGTPGTMQLDTGYRDLISEVFSFLLGRIEYAVSSGIDRENIIIDPGLGFGKSAEGNYELLDRLSEFRSLGRPILVGASRKSFIGKATGADVSGRLPGTLAASTAAILNGARIIRVHDVKEARQAADVADAVRMSGKRPV